MNQEIVLTPGKYAEVQAEIEHLTGVERPAIAERIRQARALGDLSENFDYQDAKRQQGFLEGRIANLKKTLEIARVVVYETGTDSVALGSHVVLYDQEYDEDIEYDIVGVLEADPAHARISNTSPVGQALLGGKVGETVEVKTPAGKTIYRIKEIR